MINLPTKSSPHFQTKLQDQYESSNRQNVVLVGADRLPIYTQLKLEKIRQHKYDIPPPPSNKKLPSPLHYDPIDKICRI